jgi:hypothetical protein
MAACARRRALACMRAGLRSGGQEGQGREGRGLGLRSVAGWQGDASRRRVRGGCGDRLMGWVL